MTWAFKFLQRDTRFCQYFRKKNFHVSSLHRNCQLTEADKIKEWRHLFHKRKVPEPDISIREITNHVAKRQISASEKLLLFSQLCKRRLDLEPLQYVIGEWDFRLLTLYMKEPVFIPRPETELLVELVLNDIKEHYEGGNKGLRVLEPCCGSGAISLSLLKENDCVNCTAIDTLPEAVNLTLKNSEYCDLTERLSVSNIDIQKFEHEGSESCKFDLLVCNPPYIPSDQLSHLDREVIDYESLDALDGGDDGLELIDVILTKAQYLVKSGGSIWLEVDSHHPPILQYKVFNGTYKHLAYVATHMNPL